MLSTIFQPGDPISQTSLAHAPHYATLTQIYHYHSNPYPAQNVVGARSPRIDLIASTDKHSFYAQHPAIGLEIFEVGRTLNGRHVKNRIP